MVGLPHGALKPPELEGREFSRICVSIISRQDEIVARVAVLLASGSMCMTLFVLRNGRKKSSQRVERRVSLSAQVFPK